MTENARKFLDEIKARADAATEGPWEFGDRLHVQGESHCDCNPLRGPLVRREVMDINGEQMMAHVHRQEEARWPHGIYAKDGEVVVNDTEEYGYMDDFDAEFIAHARTDLPAMAAALTAVLNVHAPTTADVIGDPQGRTTLALCTECDIEDYPCPTVRAITDALSKE